MPFLFHSEVAFKFVATFIASSVTLELVIEVLNYKKKSTEIQKLCFVYWATKSVSKRLLIVNHNVQS